MEYIYHIIIPRQFANNVNDCFDKLSPYNKKPFIYKISIRPNGEHLYTGAYGMSDADVSIFRIMFDLDEKNIHWWRTEKDTGILDDCNDADCLSYLGEKYSMKFFLRRSGFFLLGDDDGESWSSKKVE